MAGRTPASRIKVELNRRARLLFDADVDGDGRINRSDFSAWTPGQPDALDVRHADVRTLEASLRSGRVPLEELLAPTGIVLGTTLLDATLTKEFQSVVAYPPDGGRFLAKTWQPVIRTQAAELNAPDVEIAAVGVRIRPIGRRP